MEVAWNEVRKQTPKEIIKIPEILRILVAEISKMKFLKRIIIVRRV